MIKDRAKFGEKCSSYHLQNILPYMSLDKKEISLLSSLKVSEKHMAKSIPNNAFMGNVWPLISIRKVKVDTSNI